MKKFDGSKNAHDKNQSIIRFGGKSIRTVLLSLILVLGLSTSGFAFGKGSKGPDVFVVQGMLKSIGSYSGKITGHYNSLTVKGVRYFQKTHGLPITGAVDKATFESISYAYAVVKYNAGGGAGNGAGEGGGAGGGAGEGGGTGGGAGEGGGTGGGAGEGGGSGGGAGVGGTGGGAGEGGAGGGAGEGGGAGGGAGEDQGGGQVEQPGKGETEQPGKGETEQPGKGETEQPGKGGTVQPGKGGTEEPSKGGNENPPPSKSGN